MGKKVLILSGSPRKGGNSDSLCDEFARGAIERGNEVEKIRVAEKNIGYCLGCYACKDGACIQGDDMAEILEKIIACDVLVLASPVYFYSVSAQLKTLIDRTVARWEEVRDKELYYIATCADEETASTDTTLACFRGYADCIEGAKEMGFVLGTGVHEWGAVRTTAAMQDAYELGKSVR